MSFRVGREFVPGLYQHYKGPLYVALCIVRDGTNDANYKKMVLYYSVEHGPKDLHVREEYEFLSSVGGLRHPVDRFRLIQGEGSPMVGMIGASHE